MILATPVVPGFTDYAQLASDMKRRGSLTNHVHLILSRQQDEDVAYKFGDEVSNLFRRSVFIGLEPLERSNIQLANDLFRRAAEFVSTYKSEENEFPNPALLYTDPSYRPSKNCWLDTIQADYYLKAAPMVMGRWKLDNEEAKIFQGPIIVAREFFNSSALINYLQPNALWRQSLKWELSKDAKETELIGTGADAILKPQPVKKQ